MLRLKNSNSKGRHDSRRCEVGNGRGEEERGIEEMNKHLIKSHVVCPVFPYVIT